MNILQSKHYTSDFMLKVVVLLEGEPPLRVFTAPNRFSSNVALDLALFSFPSMYLS